MKHIVIGVSGKIGSGKNTVADLIQKHANIEFKQTAFAKKLKQIVALLCEVDYESTLSQNAKNTYIPEYDSTIGLMYQEIGTKVMREAYRKDVWIQSLLLELKNKPANYLVTDVRFINEAEALKNIDAILIRVSRTNNDTALKSNRDLTHSSETELDNYDGFTYYINNDGTLEDLENEVIGWLRRHDLLKKKNPIFKLTLKWFKRKFKYVI